MLPPVGLSCRRISLDVVVLPQPDSPITPRVSPSAIAKSTPSTAFTQPILRCRRLPVLTAKCLVRLSTSSNGDGIALPRLTFGQPAPCSPRRGKDGLARLVAGAARQRGGTARVEGAAARRVREIRRLAGDGAQLLLAAELGHRSQQGPGVRVLGVVEELAH